MWEVIKVFFTQNIIGLVGYFTKCFDTKVQTESVIISHTINDLIESMNTSAEASELGSSIQSSFNRTPKST